MCGRVCVSLCVFFFFWASISLCWFVCVDVLVCIWGKRRRRWEESYWVCWAWRRERKKMSEWEISKIINGWATVIVYIYTVTVARVEIYTFLHNLKSTDVEHFWGKMYKNCVLFLFLPFGPNGFFYFANSSFLTHFILFGFFSPLSFIFFWSKCASTSFCLFWYKIFFEKYFTRFTMLV